MNSDLQLDVKQTANSQKEFEKDVLELQQLQDDKNQVNNEQEKTQQISLNYNIAFIISICFCCLYLIISMLLTKNVSIQWIWAIYLSPILIVQIMFLFFRYKVMLDKYDPSQKADNQTELSFGKVSLLLPFLLFFWPIFIIIYSTAFNKILKIELNPIQQNNFTLTYGDIVYSNSINFQNENYTMLLINFQQGQDNISGYGCISDSYQSSITNIHPRPYSFYQLEVEQLDEIEEAFKLPSWFCGNNIGINNGSITNQTYRFQGDLFGKPFLKFSNHTLINNLILFDEKVYMPLTYWIIFIILAYQQLWFFTCLLIHMVLYFYQTLQLKTSQENCEPQTLSNIKRGKLIFFGTLQMFSLLNLLMEINFNQNLFKIIFILILVLPGFIIWIATFCSFYQKTVWTLIKLIYSKVKNRVIEGFKSKAISDRMFSVFLILMIPICFILLRLCYLVCSIYFILSIINLRLYLSRHFVSYWKGIEEKKLTKLDYDLFFSKFYFFEWIFRGPLLIIFLTLFQNESSNISFSFYLVFFFSLLEIAVMIKFLTTSDIKKGSIPLIYDEQNRKQGSEEGATMVEKINKDI